MKSDPGSGIHVGAWHALPPPPEPMAEVTVLGQIQLLGNPAFEGKTITRIEAWVDGQPAAVTPNPANEPLADDVAFANVKVTLAIPENTVRESYTNSTVTAEKKLKIKFGSSDSRFAPSVERFNFRYSITSPDTAPATSAKFEVFKAGDLNNPVHVDAALTLTADKVDYAQGGAPGWDGKMNRGADSGQYIQPKTARSRSACRPPTRPTT